MVYDDFAKLALAMPGVTERVGRYEIDLNRDGNHISRLRSKGTLLAIRVPWDVLEEYSKLHPEMLTPHPHYHDHPYIVAVVEKLDISVATKLLDVSWEFAPESLPKRGA